MTITNSTIADNWPTYEGGGILFSEDAVVVLKNTIVAPNGYGDCLSYGSNTVASHGNNLDSDGSCNLTGPGDLPNTDPWLLPLGDFGGPTLTQPPGPVSSAIDAGDDTACPAVDQRGVARPLDGDGDGTPHCDIGAVEYNDILPLRTYLSLVSMPN